MFAAPQAKIATPVSNVLQKTVTLLDLNQLNSSKGTCYWQLRYLNSKDSCWIRARATERKEIKQNMQIIFRILMATCHSGLH